MTAAQLESIANKVEDLAHDPNGSIAYAKQLRAEARKLRDEEPKAETEPPPPVSDPEITVDEAPATEP